MKLEFRFTPTSDLKISLSLYRHSLGFTALWHEGAATAALTRRHRRSQRDAKTRRAVGLPRVDERRHAPPRPARRQVDEPSAIAPRAPGTPARSTRSTQDQS